MKVLNTENRVSGPISLLLLSLLIGCSGGGPSIGKFVIGPIPPPFTTPSTTGAATSLYVVEQPQMKPGSILQFNVSASGSAVPIATLNAPANLYVYSIASDSAGALYVGGNVPSAPSEILIYGPSASGTASPYQTIPGGDGSFADPQSMAFDTFGNLFVGGGNSCIAMFAPHSVGYQIPYGLIQGALTQIANPNGLAVDKVGNIYVANGGAPGVAQVLIFDASARGNIAPTAILSGDQTTLGNPQGVATDLAGNLYVTDHGAILEFAPGATGNVAPIRTIGPGLGSIGGLRVDGAGNLFVVGTDQGSPFALIFPPTASGSSAPTTTFTSAAWTSPGYAQLALY